MKGRFKVLFIATFFFILMIFPSVVNAGSISGMLEWAKNEVGKGSSKVWYVYGASHGGTKDKDSQGRTVYDCSSFVWFALKEGGNFNVAKAGASVAPASGDGYIGKLGFTSKSDATKDGWSKGDILYNDNHIMIAAKDGKGSTAEVYDARGKDYGLQHGNHSASGFKVWHFTGTDDGGGSGGNSTPLATRMKDKMQEEIKSAEYSFVSDTTIVTIKKVSTGNSKFWLSHIIVSSPNQIVFGNVQEQTKAEYQEYEKSKKTVKGTSVVSSNDYLDSVGGILAVNGGNFDVNYGTHLPDTTRHGAGHAKVIIRNNEVYEDDGGASGNEICLLKDGNLTGAYGNESADNMVKRGVKEVFASGEIRLIDHIYRPGVKDGGTPGDLSDRYKDQESDDTKSGHNGYDNTIIAMVEPGNYYTLSPINNSKTYWSDVRKYMWDLGCVFCKSLDSGGSASLSFREGNKGKSKVLEKSDGREVPSFVYFREFKEGDPLLGNGEASGGGNQEDQNAGQGNEESPMKKYIPDEGDLVGMEGVLDKISDDADLVGLPDGSDLSSQEKNAIGRVRDEKKAKERGLIGSILHTIVISIGVLLLAYISLLWAFWIFDAVNSVITFSLVSVITFGHYRKTNGLEEKSDKKELSLQRLIVVSLIAFLVSWAIISGGVFTVAQSVLNGVTGLIGLTKR